jgi:hypothetical protein
MKFRKITLPTGRAFSVPQGIQRIDSKSTHGWQVRLQGTKLFSDGESADAQQSLVKAIKELLVRTAAMPATVPTKTSPSAHKTSDLPSGISGPIVRARPGKPLTAELSVLLPRLGHRHQVKSIYIGSQNTYTVAKYLAALEKGLEMRRAALERYELEAQKAHQQTIKALRTELRALSK